MIEEKICLENLNPETVNVLWQKTITVDGTTYDIDLPRRCCYSNSVYGRERVQEDLPEKYQAAIFAVWGDAPTITDLSSQQ